MSIKVCLQNIQRLRQIYISSIMCLQLVSYPSNSSGQIPKVDPNSFNPGSAISYPPVIKRGKLGIRKGKGGVQQENHPTKQCIFQHAMFILYKIPQITIHDSIYQENHRTKQCNLRNSSLLLLRSELATSLGLLIPCPFGVRSTAQTACPRPVGVESHRRWKSMDTCHSLRIVLRFLSSSSSDVAS